MLTPNCQLIALQKIQHPVVNTFYKRVYKRGVATKNEQVFVFKEAGNIICSAKLKTLESNLLLTGVACAPQYRQQGYASALVTQLLARQTQSIFCFPYPDLVDFYQRVGFTLLPLAQAPETIQVRFSRYQKNRKLLLMIYK